MDLDQDYTINGRRFKAGKNVETKVDEPDGKGGTHSVDYADSLKEMQESTGAAATYAQTHHGAVPAPKDPMEATAQTPTRPLAAPNVRVDEVIQTPTTSGPIVEVKDPSADGEGRSADESNKDVLEGGEGKNESIVANQPVEDVESKTDKKASK